MRQSRLSFCGNLQNSCSRYIWSYHGDQLGTGRKRRKETTKPERMWGKVLSDGFRMHHKHLPGWPSNDVPRFLRNPNRQGPYKIRVTSDLNNGCQ